MDVLTLVLTRDPKTFQTIREGLAASSTEGGELVEDSADAVVRLCNPKKVRPRLAFVDLATVPDGARFIDFVKGSPSIRPTFVAAITETPSGESAVFAKGVGAQVLTKPVSAKEAARIAALVNSEKRGPLAA